MSTAQQFLISTLIWGTTWIAITFQLGSVAPEASVTYRFLLAGGALFLWARLKGESLALNGRQQLWMALLGLFYAVNYAFIYRAEMQISSGLVAVAGSAMLFFNIVLSRWLFGSPITRELTIGAGLGVLGMLLVFWPEVAAFSGRDGTLGVAFALIGSFGASCANMVAMRNAKVGLPVLTTNAWWMLWCAGFMAVAVPLSGAEFAFEWSAGYVLSLLYLAIFGSVIAFSCYLALVGKIGASRASYIAVLTPIVALIISTFFEDMQWHLSSGFGVLAIGLGQFLILHGRSKQSAAPATTATSSAAASTAIPAGSAASSTLKSAA
ncbi:MAG TPA: EamA family transporter [Permianibacter sp.]|nr:EamA family transporter [Permianibacter sp.]